jgi:hypothetical protein
MSVGRQWVRWLGLLLAAGLVVQVPGLVGIGVSGASANNASYSVQLSIDPSTCVATVTATWSGTKPQEVQFNVDDLTTLVTDNATDSSLVSVSGNPGTLSHRFTLNKKPIGTDSFNASASFYGAQNNWAQAYSKPPSVDAPCYLGTLGVV